MIAQADRQAETEMFLTIEDANEKDAREADGGDDATKIVKREMT